MTKEEYNGLEATWSKLYKKRLKIRKLLEVINKEMAAIEKMINEADLTE